MLLTIGFLDRYNFLSGNSFVLYIILYSHYSSTIHIHQMNRANNSSSNSVWTYTTDTTSNCNLLNTHCVSDEEEERY